MDLNRLVSSRSSSINGSGIRRVFDEAARTPGAIKLFIGQPDFPVDRSIKAAAVAAIEHDQNGYTLTQGLHPLLDRIASHLKWDVGWDVPAPVAPGAPAPTGGGSPDGPEAMVTSGTSGALVLACMALLNPGDEIIVPDPWFVLYPYMAHLVGGVAVPCDTYPDFRMTAQRVEPLITPRTKAVLVCSPGNPSGVVLSQGEQRELVELCRRRGVLLISDEIYDEFAFSEALTARAAGDGGVRRCPSPAREPGAAEGVLLVRGFGKTYGVTGWRLGYAAGPAAILREMRKLQQYLYVCAPAPLQAGAVAAFGVDMAPHLAQYQARRDEVLAALGPFTEVPTPGGAFYAFVKVPERLGLTGEEFYQRAKAHKVFVVPGRTFSKRDTHFRLSFACNRSDLTAGLDVLSRLLRG